MTRKYTGVLGSKLVCIPAQTSAFWNLWQNFLKNNPLLLHFIEIIQSTFWDQGLPNLWSVIWNFPLRAKFLSKEHPSLSAIFKESHGAGGRKSLSQWNHRQWDLHRPNLIQSSENCPWRLSEEGGRQTKTLHNCPLFLILLEIILGLLNE